MVTKNAFIIFILPAIASLVFGGAVMYGLAYNQDGISIQPAPEPARAAQTESQLVIEGLLEEYDASEKVEIQVLVDDPGFKCGDLYISIVDPDEKRNQKSYRSVCADDDGQLEIDPEFSEQVGTSGTYNLEVDLVNSNIPNLSAGGTFTVK
ncbi:MAG: hypothetical protein EB828_01965 [Nitrosopumilus sp. D6]|nr:MAG: hypothetical protein EB828_01965 [Nitrosopumilus sp. D6]